MMGEHIDDKLDYKGPEVRGSPDVDELKLSKRLYLSLCNLAAKVPANEHFYDAGRLSGYAYAGYELLTRLV